jgi:hypothetical protein
MNDTTIRHLKDYTCLLITLKRLNLISDSYGELPPLVRVLCALQEMSDTYEEMSAYLKQATETLKKPHV